MEAFVERFSIFLTRLKLTQDPLAKEMVRQLSERAALRWGLCARGRRTLSCRLACMCQAGSGARGWAEQ